MRLPILMYHRVEEIPGDPVHPGNFVPPARFTEGLTALRERGYQSVTFADWLAYRKQQKPLPRRPLILTFDDGYRSVCDNAWPQLRAHGFHATTVVVTAQLGGFNVGDPHERPAPFLTADESPCPPPRRHGLWIAHADAPTSSPSTVIRRRRRAPRLACRSC